MYEGYEQDVQNARENWRITRKDIHDGYRLIEAEAATGSRYVVCAVPLFDAGKAIVGGQALVSVLYPWNAVWSCALNDTLDMTYVVEHWVPPTRQQVGVHGGDLAALTLTIAAAVGGKALIR